ncbi:hypothetical protein GGS26DRAFT_597038 [Hypomontagnella submonticulosa]|nr:hypothetical protein GGS26DRAFT_597038 [Hypomontagnella submonticulosa]
MARTPTTGIRPVALCEIEAQAGKREPRRQRGLKYHSILWILVLFMAPLLTGLVVVSSSPYPLGGKCQFTGIIHAKRSFPSDISYQNVDKTFVVCGSRSNSGCNVENDRDGRRQTKKKKEKEKNWLIPVPETGNITWVLALLVYIRGCMGRRGRTKTSSEVVSKPDATAKKKDSKLRPGFLLLATWSPAPQATQPAQKPAQQQAPEKFGAWLIRSPGR